MSAVQVSIGLTWLAAASLSTILCLGLIPLARRIGWVDRPDARKPHKGDIPMVGGFAMLVAAALTLAFVEGGEALTVWFAIGCFAMFLTGLVDDRLDFGAGKRFAIHVVICTVCALKGPLLLANFGALFSSEVLGLGPLAVPLTVFSVVGLINAFNMVDGMDGLAGTIFLVAISSMGVCAALAHSPVLGVLGVVGACVSGYLLCNARFPWNRRARVFMGDSGSMLLGFCLAWFTVTLSQGPTRSFAPVTAIWFCAVPLLDTGSLIIRRVSSGHGAFNADLHHLHHLFLRAGFTVAQTWLIVASLAVMLAGIGLAGELAGLPEHWRFYAFLLVVVIYHATVSRLWRRGRVFGRDIVEMKAARLR